MVEVNHVVRKVGVEVYHFYSYSFLNVNSVHKREFM